MEVSIVRWNLKEDGGKALIPYGQLCNKLEYLCELNDIGFVKQEESYTSKASFWDRDDLPVYNANHPKEYLFTASGKTIHADVNEALNIKLFK